MQFDSSAQTVLLTSLIIYNNYITHHSYLGLVKFFLHLIVYPKLSFAVVVIVAAYPEHLNSKVSCLLLVLKFFSLLLATVSMWKFWKFPRL